jgi:hypothetical protein
MHIVLLALGLAIGVAGIALIGFGIPNNTAALGTTLILAGTIAVVGGLILIGIAAAIRELDRIVQALEGRPLPRPLTVEEADAPAPASASLRARPVAIEPGLAAVEPPSAAGEARVEPSLEPPERPAVPVTAPQADTRDAEARAEDAQEAQAEQAPVAPEPAVSPPSALAPPEPPAAPEKAFDTIWAGEPAPTATRETAAVAGIESGRVEERAAPPREPEPAKIFKSGVIDGMAYTLYTDGSIEAELAQGTVKFSSIDDLRAYLAAREG